MNKPKKKSSYIHSLALFLWWHSADVFQLTCKLGCPVHRPPLYAEWDSIAATSTWGRSNLGSWWNLGAEGRNKPRRKHGNVSDPVTTIKRSHSILTNQITRRRKISNIRSRNRYIMRHRFKWSWLWPCRRKVLQETLPVNRLCPSFWCPLLDSSK